MILAIDSLIATAISEEGYLEKSKAAYDRDPCVLDSKTDGAGNDNYTKYARDLWKQKYFNSSKQGVAWCAVFVSWCFFKTFGKQEALRQQCQPSSNNAGAGCTSAANYYKSKGRFYSSPQAGDQIFFYESDGGGFGHTGIVEKVTADKVYTIEGNTSAGREVIPNGGAVCRKSYVLSNSRIGGYGRPDYKEDEGEKHMDEYDAMVVANSGKTVNMRSQPNKKADVVAAIPVGTIVKVVDEYNSEWKKIAIDGTQGYMMSAFLREEEKDKHDQYITIMLKREVAQELYDALRGVVGE